MEDKFKENSTQVLLWCWDTVGLQNSFSASQQRFYSQWFGIQLGWHLVKVIAYDAHHTHKPFKWAFVPCLEANVFVSPLIYLSFSLNLSPVCIHTVALSYSCWHQCSFFQFIPEEGFKLLFVTFTGSLCNWWQNPTKTICSKTHCRIETEIWLAVVSNWGENRTELPAHQSPSSRLWLKQIQLNNGK